MSAGNRYVLDANVFIQSHRMHYAFDICPGFWSALKRQHDLGKVCSIDKVKAELIEEGDQLAAWVKNAAPEAFFRETADANVINVFSKLVNWAQTQSQFTPEAKAEFATVADAWLVAFARVNGLTVVTHEEYAPQAKRSIKIPNVCVEFGVNYCSTFEMLRGLKEQFVLKTRQKKR